MQKPNLKLLELMVNRGSLSMAARLSFENTMKRKFPPSQYKFIYYNIQGNMEKI